MSRRKAALAGVTLLLLGLLSCSPGYVLRSAWYQAELLRSRVPVQEARKSGRLSAEQLTALDRVRDVKAFGLRLGLEATRNYESVALGWDRRIWNVNACEPLAFRPKTWWFPIVGRVPYRGYFERHQADSAARQLDREGWDVNVREAPAYSTLGWFRDPLLPSMLSWGEFDLADTILHELAHATVWVKGDVPFNEAFADFVGEEGAFRYLEGRYGTGSPAYQGARRAQEDRELWREVQWSLFHDLERVYADSSLDDDAKRRRKAALFAAMPERVAAAPFHDRAPYERAVRERRWNNAHLANFRTYQGHRPAFAKLLEACGGEMATFIARIRALAERDDPLAELARATERK